MTWLGYNGGSGYVSTDSTVTCVITRFRFGSMWSVLSCFWRYRRVRASTHNIPGMLKSMFVFEDRYTCYTLSLWTDDASILRFNTTSREHIDAANWSLTRLAIQDGRPELWSAQFRLAWISESNLSWPGVNIGHLRHSDESQRHAQLG